MVKVWRTVLVLTPLASKAFALAGNEIFGRAELLVDSAGIAKAAFISDFQLGDFRPFATSESGGLFPVCP